MSGLGVSWADYLRRNYRDSVVRSYGNAVEQYLREILDAETATYTEILDYVDGLRRRGLHAKTLRNHLSAIKVYYDWRQRSGRREDHPCARLRLRDPVDRRVRLDGLYAAGELAAWLAANPERRRRVAAGLLVHQGLMSAEAVRLDVGDVDLHAGTVSVTGGGKTASRELALKASQVLELDAYIKGERRQLHKLAARGERSERLLLTAAGRPLATAGLSALVNAGFGRGDRLLPLRVRQSVIAELLAAGHDVRVVQAFAGHRTATATEGYRRSGLEELAAAVRALHPRG